MARTFFESSGKERRSTETTAVESFSAARMVADYERAYERLVAEV